jgi:hypothetical protein
VPPAVGAAVVGGFTAVAVVGAAVVGIPGVTVGIPGVTTGAVVVGGFTAVAVVGAVVVGGFTAVAVVGAAVVGIPGVTVGAVVGGGFTAVAVVGAVVVGFAGAAGTAHGGIFALSAVLKVPSEFFDICFAVTDLDSTETIDPLAACAAHAGGILAAVGPAASACEVGQAGRVLPATVLNVPSLFFVI